MKNKLLITGVGPGSIELVSKSALQAISEADVLIGGRRNLNTFCHFGKEEFELKNNLEQMLQFIKNNIDKKSITVLGSGDPLLFGIGTYIIKNLTHSQIEIETISGISSIQYLASKTGKSLDSTFMCSVHGRKSNLLENLKIHESIGLFTSSEPESVLSYLCEHGYGNLNVVAGEDLSYVEEKISFGTVETLSKQRFSSLTVMLIEGFKENCKWDFCGGGMPDAVFVRGSVPMTKEEIRAISLSKLRIKKDSIVWDIGAGTGSVTVECGIHAPFGKVVAFEKNAEAIGLIKENCNAFALSNVKIVEGDILDTLSDCKLAHCSRAFVGGSGGNMDFILQLLSKNNPIRIVANTVTVESTYEALKSFQKYGYKNIECISVSISKSSAAGDKHIMKAQNTVNLISGEKGEI